MPWVIPDLFVLLVVVIGYQPDELSAWIHLHPPEALEPTSRRFEVVAILDAHALRNLFDFRPVEAWTFHC